jgi:hypothetical protein
MLFLRFFLPVILIISFSACCPCKKQKSMVKPVNEKDTITGHIEWRDEERIFVKDSIKH